MQFPPPFMGPNGQFAMPPGFPMPPFMPPPGAFPAGFPMPPNFMQMGPPPGVGFMMPPPNVIGLAQPQLQPNASSSSLAPPAGTPPAPFVPSGFQDSFQAIGATIIPAASHPPSSSSSSSSSNALLPTPPVSQQLLQQQQQIQQQQFRVTKCFVGRLPPSLDDPTIRALLKVCSVVCLCVMFCLLAIYSFQCLFCIDIYLAVFYAILHVSELNA